MEDTVTRGIGKEDFDLPSSESYPYAERFTRQSPIDVRLDLTRMPNVWKTHQVVVNPRYFGDHACSLDNINLAIANIGAKWRVLYLEPGTWEIGDDLTIASNIIVYASPGCTLNIAAGKTLTINGPFEAGLYQVFSGTGTVTFGAGAVEKVYPQWRGANNNETTTEDETAIEWAIAAAPTGGTVFFPAGSQYYKIADIITVNKALTLEGEGEASEIRQVTSNKGGFAVTASNVTVKNLKLYGPQYTVSKSSEIAITAYGADSSNYINNLRIEDCIITNWGADGIYTLFVEDFWFENLEIENIYYAGIICLSSKHGHINNPLVNNVVGDPNAYGIALTRTGNDSLATYPRSSDITVSNPDVRSVINWHGLDTHAGERISFIGGKVYGCNVGVNIGPGKDTGGNTDFAPLDCHVIGIEIDSGSPTGASGAGITFGGASDTVEKATGSIIGNIIRDHGDEDAASGRAIYFDITQNLIIQGNTIINPSPLGIYFCHDNVGFNISGNVIQDAWSDSLGAGTTYCIYQLIGGGANNKGYIGGNTFVKDTAGDHAAATRLMETGIFIPNEAGNAYEIGKNYSECTTYISDAGGYGNPLFGSVVWDPGNLVDGAGETKQITVTGAALGDFVLVSAPYDLQDCTVNAYVQAANTVEIHLQNESTGAIDFASGTWKVKVMHPDL